MLFYFNGNDSNPFVEAGKVVSIDTIREQYPDYAANMKDDMIPASPADGVKYAVPFYGYWEGLFVNKAVCEAAGIEIPGAGSSSAFTITPHRQPTPPFPKLWTMRQEKPGWQA